MSARGWLSQAGRLARTVSHLHPAQVAFRPIHLARTALLARVPAAASLVAGDPQVSLGPPILALRGTIPAHLAGVEGELAAARKALLGISELVGREVRIDPPRTDFLAPEDPKLVRYQLNYLGAAKTLAIASRVEGFADGALAASRAIAHLREFVERVPPGQGDAWEPYVVATRLLNAIVARELLRPLATVPEAGFLDGPLLHSLAQHARWMAATLELHLLGNHLFTNGAALFVAGCALQMPGSASIRTLGHAIVARSLAEDVLGDGGHGERSPMYAALYLDQLELVIAAARALGVGLPGGAMDAATAMASQLLAIAHPDGQIPLIGDSALGESPLAADLAAPLGLEPDSLRRRLYGPLLAATDGPKAADARLTFPDTGLTVVRSPGSLLVVDHGPLGTPDQPGHSHADALSLELSHAGRRLIVDGGAGHYHADEQRAYFRGPWAHSSVSVDGRGSDEVWSSFRAGGRARLRPLLPQVIGPLHVLRGHVRAAGGWRHERLVFYAPGRLLAVFDRVTGVHEGALVESHVHFAPDVAVKLDGSTAVVEQDGQRFALTRLTGAGWSVHKGESRPPRGFTALRMGRFEASPEVAVEATGLGEASGAAWALLLGPEATVTGRGASVRLEVPGARVQVGLDGRGLRWEQL